MEIRTPIHQPDVRYFAGIPFRQVTQGAASQWVAEMAGTDRAGAVAIHLLNAYSIALSTKDPAFRRVLDDAEINLPDGKPISWFTRGTARALHQVRGPQFFEDVMSDGRELGLRHFLLGGTEKTLRDLVGELEFRHPGVQIVGIESPPFRVLTSEEHEKQDERIRASGAQIVWVGLGTPKQDFEAARLARSLGIPAAAVGAAFDFSAGAKAEAPGWIRAVGLEWLFRFLAEPRRLWRRYLIGNFVFLRVAALDWLRTMSSQTNGPEATRERQEA